MSHKAQNIERYDAFIVGSGQGGTPLAFALANAGWKVALVEREFVGGTCVNRGCTPTKTMVTSARTAYMTDGLACMEWMQSRWELTWARYVSGSKA